MRFPPAAALLREYEEPVVGNAWVMALPERRDLDHVVYERLLPAVPENVSRLRRGVQGVLARHRLAADRASDVGLVVSEAATNAVLHAYREDRPARSTSQR